MARNCTKNYNKWYFLVPFVLFCFVGYGITKQFFAPIDKNVYTYISQYIHPMATTLFQMITIMGTFGMMMVITIIIYFKNKELGKKIFISLIISSFLKEGLKHLFMRSRPNIVWLVAASGYSFPSGHATLSLCFYGLCIYFLVKSSFAYKRVVSIILVFLILGIGFSRIYLGVHYFSDIVGGFLLGTTYLLYVINNFRLKT